MAIEFVTPGGTAASAELYRERADWLDRQISKAVLGQTTSSDAIAGGHAVSREHRLVQEDIERADARALAAVLNRDLIRPWVDLEWGPQPRYPRLALVRPEAEDIERMARTLGTLVPLGLRVESSEVRDRLGFADPAQGSEVLTPPGTVAPASGTASLNGTLGVFKRGPGHPATWAAPGAAGPSAALPAPPGIGAAAGARMQAEVPPAPPGAPPDAPPALPPDAPALLAARLEAAAQPAIAAWLARIEAMLAAAGSLEEAREMLLAAFPDLDTAPLAEVLGQAMTAAHLAGRVEVGLEAGEDG
jgi:phage gp29-like protein